MQLLNSEDKRPENFVTIATFTHPVEAHLAMTKLNSYGIDAILTDEHTASLDWVDLADSGAIELRVEEGLAEKAASVLGLEGFYFEEEAEPGEESGPVCKICNSRDVRGSGPLTLLARLFDLPFIKKSYECGRCGYRWEE